MPVGVVADGNPWIVDVLVDPAKEVVNPSQGREQLPARQRLELGQESRNTDHRRQPLPENALQWAPWGSHGGQHIRRPQPDTLNETVTTSRWTLRAMLR